MIGKIDRDALGFGSGARAVYASHPHKSRGRLVPEEESLTRSPFQRDRDRIIHSTAFRRLKHKTQVFIAHEDDHYRTRLTHTIEVSQIARALARALKLDEDLAEGVALVHDFGHTPFGHAGEDELDDILKHVGGFDHNAQSLKIVTQLEQRYAEFDGLNLTWESLEGLVKHNGPLIDQEGNEHSQRVPLAIRQYNAQHDLWLSSHASLEAQCAAIADDIAYNAHDIDDGLRSGLLTLDMLKDVPFVSDLIDEVQSTYPDLEPTRVIHEISRRQITKMVEDVIATAQQRLAQIKPETADDVRLCGQTIVGFSDDMVMVDQELKDFLYRHLYRHENVLKERELAVQIIRELYHALIADPTLMADHRWLKTYNDLDEAAKARHIGDYISGMTDNYAQNIHNRIFHG